MTESEQLKEASQRQYARERIGEVKKYMDGLFVELKVLFPKVRMAFVVYLICLGIYIAAVFFSMPELGVPFFILGLLYMAYYREKVGEKFSELQGAMKVLELLELVDKDEEIGEKKKQKILNEFTDTVKRWFAEKKEVQEKVYSPA